MSQIPSSKNPIQVADRLFAILEMLALRGSCGLMELTIHLNLHKSTVHRLLTSLTCLGYVKQDDNTGKYRLTFKITALSNTLLSKIDILDIARPHLKKLMERTGETVHLVQLDGDQAVYIDKVEAYQNSIRMGSRVGNHIPLYCSGVGKALAALLPQSRMEDIWNTTSHPSITPYTIVDYQIFLKELEQIRTMGYALDNEENELGVRCVAAALFHTQTRVLYAFSISAPANRMTDSIIKTYSALILDTKAELSREFI